MPGEISVEANGEVPDSELDRSIALALGELEESETQTVLVVEIGHFPLFIIHYIEFLSCVSDLQELQFHPECSLYTGPAPGTSHLAVSERRSRGWSNQVLNTRWY